MNGVCSGLGIMNFPDGSKYDIELRYLEFISQYLFDTDTKENSCKDGFMAMASSSDPTA